MKVFAEAFFEGITAGTLFMLSLALTGGLLVIAPIILALKLALYAGAWVFDALVAAIHWCEENA